MLGVELEGVAKTALDDLITDSEWTNGSDLMTGAPPSLEPLLPSGMRGGIRLEGSGEVVLVGVGVAMITSSLEDWVGLGGGVPIMLVRLMCLGGLPRRTTGRGREATVVISGFEEVTGFSN